jgi:class 3 adenylate cyclase
MPWRQVGAWVTDFYDRVDRAAAPHGVRKVEVRGDCCICVADDDPGAAVGGAGPVTRALAFVADLHADLAAAAATPGGRAIAARVGMASGPVALLEDEAAEGRGAGRNGGHAAQAVERGGEWCFRSVQGDTVNVAARMEALGCPGAAVVHKSAADRWAAEGGRAGPRTVCVNCKGRGVQRAAVYDLGRRTWRGEAEAAADLPVASLRSLSDFRLPDAIRRSLNC